jgi:hypothetical protein
MAAASLMRLASPHRLRPQVFSTSRRFDPPRACRPCFMPNPLMGLRPSELCSPRAAVRRLRRRCPPVVGHTPNETCSRRRVHTPKRTLRHLGCRVLAPCRSMVRSPETASAPKLRSEDLHNEAPPARQLGEAPKRHSSLPPSRQPGRPKPPALRGPPPDRQRERSLSTGFPHGTQRAETRRIPPANRSQPHGRSHVPATGSRLAQ